jgi:Gpi18-like mannosyltransferase
MRRGNPIGRWSADSSENLVRERAPESMKSLKASLVLFSISLGLRSASFILASRSLSLTFTQIASFQDGPSYLYLASHLPFYPDPHTVIHFPFYPLVIALFSLFISPIEMAALVVSLLAGSLAVPIYGQVLRRYTERWFEIALVFSVFPFRWFNISQLAMSEPLFLLLLLVSLLLHEKGHYLASGCVMGLSWLTKLSGVFLIPAFLFGSLRGRARLTRIILWAIPPVLFLAGFGLYLVMRFGNAGIYFQEHNRLWGGSYFSYPFSDYLSGFFDPGISWFRKPYVALVLILLFRWIDCGRCALAAQSPRMGDVDSMGVAFSR